MVCNNCHNFCYKWGKREDGTEYCNACSDVGVISSPDVYFKEPYWEENLGDVKHPHGRWISSKQEKGRIMKELGLSESGDKKHGSRMNYKEKF